MDILGITDIHGNRQLLEKLLKADSLPELVLFAGDLTLFGHRDKALKILEPALNSGLPVLALPGNCDHPDVIDLLEELEISLHGQGKAFGDVGFFGVGGSNPTPFNTPYELSEKEIASFLKNGYKNIRDCRIKILAAHMPPYNTECDKVKSGLHVGSKAVREFLEMNQVDFCLTGHIHESIGRDEVGGTCCINPGSFREGHYTMFNADENGIRNLRSF